MSFSESSVRPRAPSLPAVLHVLGGLALLGSAPVEAAAAFAPRVNPHRNQDAIRGQFSADVVVLSDRHEGRFNQFLHWLSMEAAGRVTLDRESAALYSLPDTRQVEQSWGTLTIDRVARGAPAARAVSAFQKRVNRD